LSFNFVGVWRSSVARTVRDGEVAGSNPVTPTTKQEAKIKFIDHQLKRLDHFQRSHKTAALIYAVQKKYGEDNGGQQAAMLTYYGFLSLFPLLLVAASSLQLIVHSHPAIRRSIISHATQYFPVLGDQLQANVKNVHGAGISLAVGVLLTMWGAKGVADVFQSTVNHIWGVPRTDRPGFPKSSLKSLGIVVLGGLGFLAASFLSGFATGLDKVFVLRIVPILISTLVLFGLFWLLFMWGLADSSKVGRRSLVISSLTAAVLIEVLQIVGGYLVNHELSNFKHLYGTFAITLGLLFWIYLQARVVLYAAEAGVVDGKKLWPRSLVQQDLTKADKHEYRYQAKKEKFVDPEDIDVDFQAK
jgi:membrane protein